MTDRDTFVEKDLHGARFVECDLSGVVMRGVDVAGMDIDAPWLSDGAGLLVNGVDVSSYVERELDRRFPGRDKRRAQSPSDLRAAWAAVTRAWEGAIDRAVGLPDGSVDVRVDGEWSFAETLRHLVHAIDVWFGKTVTGLPDGAFHPLGVKDKSSASQGAPFSEVRTAHASRVADVRAFLSTISEAELDEQRTNPHNSADIDTVRQCLHVVLQESWEHLRFALRDLAEVEAHKA